jgi:hypothetical protein
MSDVCVTRMLSTEWRSIGGGGVQTPNNGDSKQIHLKVSSTLQNVNSLKIKIKHFLKDNKR